MREQIHRFKQRAAQCRESVPSIGRKALVILLVLSLLAVPVASQSTLWDDFEDGDTTEWDDRDEFASGEFTAETTFSYDGDYSGFYRMTSPTNSEGGILRDLPSGTDQASFAIRVENNQGQISFGPTTSTSFGPSGDMITIDSSNNINYGGDTGVDIATSQWVIFEIVYDESNNSARATYIEDGTEHDLGVISAGLPEHFKIQNQMDTNPELYIDTISLSGSIANEITGTVTDESNNELENVTIEVYDDGTLVTSTDTDANGEYTISQIDDGQEYTINATKQGYVPQSKSVFIESGSNTVDFELREGSAALRIDSRSLLQPGQEDTFKVIFQPTDDSRRDVTDESTVTSSNTTVLDVQGDALIATDDDNASTIVQLTAETTQDGETYTTIKNVTVAQPTVENLEILPDALTRLWAVFDDPTIFALLIAGFLSVPAARFTNSFGGLATAQMVVTIGWLSGYIGTGIAMLSVFVALFIGLNLAENVQFNSGNFGGGFR